MPGSTAIRYSSTFVALFFATKLLASPLAASDYFEKSIRPILAEYCYECHFRESKGGLRMSSRAELIKGGNTGPALIPGNATQSLLIQAISRRDGDLAMPPKKPLPVADQKTLAAWIDAGAPWPVPPPGRHLGAEDELTAADRAFWSFQPVRNPKHPIVTANSFQPHPIDAYLSRGHEQKKLIPLERAARPTLLRRASFDLTGLPAEEDIKTLFLKAPSPNAFAALVDRLLASPAYGERWGGHWLDLTRYADTAGDAADFPVPEAYRYRNYVIDAFNRDKPYDQFIREQIAGDLLPADNEEIHWEQTIATGYVTTSRRIGVSPQNLKHITIEDTLDNLGKTFLGLTIGCARCHDHKFDPIPTRDYYGLYGIFSSSTYPHAGAEHQPYRRDFVYRIGQQQAASLLAPYQERLTPWAEKEREALRIYREFQFKKISVPGRTRQSTWQELVRIREEHRNVAETFPELEIAYALQDSPAPADAHVMANGDPSRKSQREQVPRGFLSILGGQRVPSTEAGSGRRQLADWIASPKNPLTARVIVNRVWHYHFGRGIVASTSDFGIRGTAPSHPDLLDYLATYLMQHNWSLKALHRHIMLSDAYQRKSGNNSDNERIDPDNIQLWRFNRQRLSAEQLRDTLLVLSGDLDRSPGQRHPFPHRLTYFYRQHEPFTENYRNNRRTIYQLRRRLEKNPYLDLFDGPDGNLHFATRRATATPHQALFFMNGRFIEERAERIAQHLVDPESTPSQTIADLYQQIFSRSPEENELLQLLEARKTGAVDWAVVVQAMISSNEFLFLD